MPDPIARPSPPAAPPALPAPPIPLSALLAREDLGLRLIAGPDDTAIQWVHTSEMADPYPYLLGGELLLTAGVLLADPERYVSRVAEAGGAAIGFGVAPVHETVPEALVRACEQHGLPLVEVPPQTPFTAIARAVWRLMAQVRLREVRRVSEAQQGLAAAAARPDPIPAVLRQLAARLGGWAVLMSSDGSALQSAGRAPAREARAALGRLVRVVSPATADTEPAEPDSHGDSVPARRTPSSATDTAAGHHLAAYALGGAEGLALGIATEAREPGGHTVAGMAVVLLSLLTAPHQGADPAAHSAALVRLLLGATPAEVAPSLAPGRWMVVHASRQGPAPDRIAATALGTALGSALVDMIAAPSFDAESTGSTESTDSAATGATVRILLPEKPREQGQHREHRIEPQSGWTLGVSAPVEAGELSAADTAAARALRRAEATREPLARQRDTGLAALVSPGEAGAHARTLLTPIADSPALTETLRVWLSLHGSWDRTAVALGVHRNTVRQRIARCGSLLGVDVDDADVRMELWFALRWL
ncbi:PucR family transcriptional regulator [Streptomyces sp. NPDC127084]|uniref:PucR family transcriptional regulator n=1 Tax=Streptomyces sp. NPDC127084 TaxID=3347133 RepID=UPI0036470B6C